MKAANPQTLTQNSFLQSENCPLAFDHDEIVLLAHSRLVSKLTYRNIARQSLPEEFTLGELQTVHEIVLQYELDIRNFEDQS